MKQFLVINEVILCKTDLDSNFRFASQDAIPHPLTALVVKSGDVNQDIKTARLATMDDLIAFNVNGNVRSMKQQAKAVDINVDELHAFAMRLSVEHTHQIGLLKWHLERFSVHEKEICEKQGDYHLACRAFSESFKKLQDTPFEQLSSQGIELIKAICRGVEELALRPLHAGMPPIPPLVEEQRAVLRDEGDNIQRSLFISLEHYYRLRSRHQCLLDIWRLNHRTEVLKKSAQSDYTQFQLIEYDHELVRTMLANKGHDIEALWSAEVRSTFLSCTDKYFERVHEMESVFGALVSDGLNERDNFIAKIGLFRH